MGIVIFIIIVVFVLIVIAVRGVMSSREGLSPPAPVIPFDSSPRPNPTLELLNDVRSHEMPAARRYGTIGPSLFAVWQGWSDEAADSEVAKKGEGIVNGAEFPGSMSRCHEGHLIGLLKSARLYGAISSLEQREHAAALLKILLDEKVHMEKMRHTTELQEVFAEGEAMLSSLRRETGLNIDILDPIAYFGRIRSRYGWKYMPPGA